VDRNGIAHRVATGRLTRLHRGVYRLGPADAPRTREAAALLACGSAAYLSHASAAILWRLPLDAPALVHVTAPSRPSSAPRGSPTRRRTRTWRAGRWTSCGGRSG
jgi:predicted transcriptional regulator of viral defense system